MPAESWGFFKGVFKNYVNTQGWVGGQKKTYFSTQNVYVICESSLSETLSTLILSIKGPKFYVLWVNHMYPKIRNFFIGFYTKFQHLTIWQNLKTDFTQMTLLPQIVGQILVSIKKLSYYYASYNLAQQTIPQTKVKYLLDCKFDKAVQTFRESGGKGFRFRVIIDPISHTFFRRINFLGRNGILLTKFF